MVNFLIFSNFCPLLFQQFAFKSFGQVEFRGGLAELASQPEAARFIKILLVEAGGNVVVDFQEYHLTHPTLFFLNAGQYHHLDKACAGTALCCNRDFYGVEIHDREVSGNSVGSNMATVVALMAKNKKGPPLKLQVLFWPVKDATFETPSYNQFATGRFLTKSLMQWFWD